MRADIRADGVSGVPCCDCGVFTNTGTIRTDVNTNMYYMYVLFLDSCKLNRNQTIIV